MIILVKGKVFAGLGEGKRFTELPWVRSQIEEQLRFKPYPGTLNLSLSSDGEAGSLLYKFEGKRIVPKKGYLAGRLYRAVVMGREPGALVRPEIPGYPDNVVEIVAPVCLREKYHLRDGDDVEVKIWLE